IIGSSAPGTGIVLSGGRNSDGSVGQAFVISAAHTATVNTKVVANADGFLSGAGAEASNNINSSVNETINGSITALAIAGTAVNAFIKPNIGDNIDGSTGGFVSAAGGTDITTIGFSTVIDVGSSAALVVNG